MSKSGTKMVLITSNEDGTMNLTQFVGGERKGVAQLALHADTTAEGIKQTVEEFRVSED